MCYTQTIEDEWLFPFFVCVFTTAILLLLPMLTKNQRIFERKNAYKPFCVWHQFKLT